MKKEEDSTYLSNFLKEQKHKNPFSTPDRYFDLLPDQIMHRISEEKISIAGRNSSNGKIILLRRLMAIAAAISVLVVGFSYWQSSSSSRDQLGQLTTQEIADYIHQNLDDYDEVDFYSEEMADMEALSEILEEEDLPEDFLWEMTENLNLEEFEGIL